MPSSVAELDLSPLPGKHYFNLSREWREEFIYFLMVDRFHDGKLRSPQPQMERSTGISTPNDFYGGTLRGVLNNLDYIAGLGCTAIWLSPIFENNAGAYHGYNISNYLAVDPHFGSKEDLVALVDAAHGYERNGEARPIRIILDVVINHSGDNWSYPGGYGYNYSGGQQFPLGYWRRNDRPMPSELRNPDCYHRRGQISNYDADPEKQLGDIDTLKDFANDDDAIGSAVINALIKAHCWWIREADIDGFRVDAVKHMGALACSRFCSNVREYAYSLGKRRFFLYGEVATADDDIYNEYIGPNTSKDDGGNTVFFGLDSVLDFRLAEGVYGDENNAPLREVLKGNKGPQTLFNRLEAQRNRALNRGEIGRYLVRFIDNHDSFWQPTGRFPNGASDEQVIGAVGFLLCGLGTPCIYYGTEQGFSGSGDDNGIREAMFDASTTTRNLLNPNCTIYQEIAKIAEVVRTNEPLRFGRMYYREISGDGITFGFPYGSDYILAFSRLLYGSETVVAYNVSSQERMDGIIIDSTLHKRGDLMKVLYGGTGSLPVQVSPSGATFVRLSLSPHGFAILKK
jgi:alpha-amylase